MYTRHGHQIEGTPVVMRDQGLPVARCGGPRLCNECREDAVKYGPPQVIEGFSTVTSDGVQPFDYQLKAKINVVEWYNANMPVDPAVGVAPYINVDNVFVVWFTKALENWKCLLATTRVDEMYFECTYNGAKNELYLDAYRKVSNVAISDQIFNS